MADTPETTRFPAWFPQGCPPEATPDAAGVVFRFVSNDPVDPDEDFRSHHEKGLAPTAQPCRRCSLSIYKDQDVARAKIKSLVPRNPQRARDFRLRFIARGELTAADGKLGQAGIDPHHFEWWAYEGFERHRNFQVVEHVMA